VDSVSSLLWWRDRVTRAQIEADRDPTFAGTVEVPLDALAELVWLADTFHTNWVASRADHHAAASELRDLRRAARS
jgi:hypothetical protein